MDASEWVVSSACPSFVFGWGSAKVLPMEHSPPSPTKANHSAPVSGHHRAGWRIAGRVFCVGAQLGKRRTVSVRSAAEMPVEVLL